ncbi:acyl-CoA thioesterase [Aliikangiella coralliicola]|uniref:Acyl-CoA thioesterase n=2 Tax=Aliikangiella coralliicola TaxID=2592383 RepID=A0A545UBA1_9GAMM|nr:acyl-CoA thioesterase [Aliikangiella coralliicola]
MDAFNHINNTVYFRYFENARIEYFERTNINALMQKTKIGPILGETECKYLAPLTYPDKITVGAKVTEIKEKRFSQHYEVFSHKMNKVVAKGRGEIVYFNYADAQTCRIPDEILAAIDRLENQVAGER